MACGTIQKAVVLGLLVPALAFVAPVTSTADPLRAAVNADASAGFARLVFEFSEDVDAGVHNGGNVLIIGFAKPVFISVDRLSVQAPDYVGAARRDPDGRAVRLALARKVTVNSIAAGAKLFVDLLPETWSGPPPSLPQEVVEELARRAREAKQLERLMQSEQQKKLARVRVHVASQPTFTRYVFDIPDQIAVSADRAGERLTLTFDAPLTFDLTDAEAALPATVAAINAEAESNSALVRFSFLAKVDVRTFRDGNSYVVDVVDADAAAATHDKAAGNAVPTLALEAGLSVKLAPEAVAPSALEAPMKVADKPNIAAPATVAAQSSSTPPAAALVSPPAPADVKPPQPAPAPVQSAQTAASAPPPARSAEAPAEAAKVETPGGAVAQPRLPSPRAKNATGDAVAVELSRQGANLKLSFPFLASTAAAVFHRADSLWIVFDSKSAIDLTALNGEASRTIRGAEFIRDGDAGVVRIRLDHPHLSSVASEGPGWTVIIGDSVVDPTRALDVSRNMIGPNRANVAVPFDEPHQLHRIRDPQVGDELLVVTGFAPARGFVNEQDFVEFHALAS